MSDRELALEITRMYFDKRLERYTIDVFVGKYNCVLNELRNNNNVLSKIENLIQEYDKKIFIGQYETNQLIDNIRNLLKGDSSEFN